MRGANGGLAATDTRGAGREEAGVAERLLRAVAEAGRTRSRVVVVAFLVVLVVLVVVVAVVFADGAGEGEGEEVDGSAMLRSRQSPVALLPLLVAAVIMGRRGVFFAWDTRDSAAFRFGLGVALGLGLRVAVVVVEFLPRESGLGWDLTVLVLSLVLAPDSRRG